jgi:two-component system, LytTR family, sensor kinase
MRRLRQVLTVRWAVLSALFWTTIGLVFALPQLSHSSDLRKTLLSALVQWWSWGLLAPGIVALDRSLPFSSWQMGRRILAHLVLGPIVTVVYGYVLALLRAAMGTGHWSTLLSKVVLTEALEEMFWSMLVYCLIVGVWEAYLYQQHYLSSELRMERLERNFSEARLNALRMQLDPHFLFNALNTVSAQVERDPKLARRMIEHLGDLLRLSLNSHGRQEIPLAEELAFLDHFLAIQRIRFGDKLSIEMRIAPEAKHAFVPSLFLQPIVENAIRHGISTRSRGGVITLSAECLDDMLVIRVADDGAGLPREWSLESHSGLGLSVTRERIASLHPDGLSSFDVVRRDEGGTEVVISFQLRMEVDNDRAAV